MVFKTIVSRSALAGIALMAITACSNKQDANKSNFKAAIQDYFDKSHGICVMAPAKQFPYKIEKKGGLRDMRHPDKAAALAKAGLLTESEAEMPNDNQWIKESIPANEYALTELGKKYLVKGAGGNISDWDGFCVGSAKVVDVESFSAPADRFGVKVSLVDYTFVIPDTPDWAKVPQMQTAFPQLQATTAKRHDKTMLIATSEGWVHEQIFRTGMPK